MMNELTEILEIQREMERDHADAQAAWEATKAELPMPKNEWILDLVRVAFLRGFKEGRGE
jgi:hypothetical protein